MSQRPEPPPEGALIKAALKKSGLSARKAAREAGLSEGRWRQIVDGYQIVSAGTYVPVRGPAETLARMAAVIGVSPDALDAAGRADAAGELRAMQDASQGDSHTPSPGETAMLQAIAAMQEEIRQLREKVEGLQGDRGDGEKIRGRKGA